MALKLHILVEVSHTNGPELSVGGLKETFLYRLDKATKNSSLRHYFVALAKRQKIDPCNFFALFCNCWNYMHYAMSELVHLNDLLCNKTLLLLNWDKNLGGTDTQTDRAVYRVVPQLKKTLENWFYRIGSHVNLAKSEP